MGAPLLSGAGQGGAGERRGAGWGGGARYKGGGRGRGGGAEARLRGAAWAAMAGTGRDGACARSAMLTGMGPPRREPPAGGGRLEGSGGPQPCVKGEGGGRRAAARSASLCVCAAPW